MFNGSQPIEILIGGQVGFAVNLSVNFLDDVLASLKILGNINAQRLKPHQVLSEVFMGFKEVPFGLTETPLVEPSLPAPPGLVDWR